MLSESETDKRYSLTLSRQTGGDPNLTGLLRVFKNYYPEIIVGDATKGRASAFKVCTILTPSFA
jgi:Mis6.